MNRYTAWLARHRRWLMPAILLLTLVAGYRTLLTYAGLRSDLEQLLPRDAASVAALDTLRARLPGVRYLGIVVDTGGAANVAAANRFLDDLRQRIEHYPPEMVAEVRADIAVERRFAETYALQLLDPDDVRALREAVEKRRDWDVRHALGIEVLEDAEDPRPELPFRRLRAKYEQRHGKVSWGGGDRFVSENGDTSVLVVRTGSHTTGYEADAALLERVELDVAALGFPAAYGGGMRVGYAGDVATRVEEMDGLRADLSVSGVLAVGLVLLSLRWFFGSWWSVGILGLPLLCGTLGTFGLVALPPLSIRHLNSNTGFLGSVIVGNGINTGIILLARFVEERRRGVALQRAIDQAVAETWRATLAAAAAASTAYGSLVFTQFRGFNQFGWIGGVGMITCWAAMYSLVPLLLGLVGKRWQFAGLGAQRPGVGHRLLEGAIAHPRWVLGVTVATSLAAVWGLGLRGSDWLENDFSRLRRRDSFATGERYWGPRMDRTLHQYLTPTLIMTSGSQAADQIRDDVAALQGSGRAGGLIASVRSARDVLPPERARALAEARQLKQVVSRRMLADLKPEDRRLVERALSDDALRPLEAEQIPGTLAAGLREHDGRIDRVIMVFPKVASGTWDGQRIRAFTDDLREVASRDPEARVAGSLPLSSDITRAMAHDGPRATYYGLGAAFLICALAFGSLRLSLLAMATVVVGVAWMMGVIAPTGARLNFANFVVLPITFGVSADYAINVLRRYQSEGTAQARAALANTAGAVGLCSATTIFGFGSLLVAQNQALFSFGLFASVGEVATLAAATLGLPALLALRGPRQVERVEAVCPERSIG